MPQKAFFIGPYEEGLVEAVKPWMISDQAFARLKNAYAWRGRIKKRVGSKPFESATYQGIYEPLGSRLRIAITGVHGTTDAAGAATLNLSTDPASYGTMWNIGSMFSIGTTFYTVWQTGAPATMLQTDATTTATFDTTNGTYVFVGAPALQQIYWYPALPVMGFANYEEIALNNEPVIAFDREFAYCRTGNAWARCGTGAAATWTGSDSQFFWSTNYRGTANDNYYLYVVNYNQPDHIRYWDGATWTAIYPDTRAYVAPANYTLQTARIIVAFKDRLIALNTIEEVGIAGVYHNFTQRARWCQNGSPIGGGAPTCIDAWYDNVPGKGGWIDAPTKEAIISAQILKDRLLVYFERSTWELVYTGNQVLPFVWQTIDDRLGAESTHGSVLFDKVVLGVGDVGIHACDGLQVTSIDSQIPDYVFDIHNENAGLDRVAGVRDYSTDMVYWAIPVAPANGVYPNSLLAYNYKNNSFSEWRDSITAFGYYQNVADLTWGAASFTWESASRTWAGISGQSQFKNVVAGNQEGFTFLMDRDIARNSYSLQITNIDITGWPVMVFTVINHNISVADFVYVQHVQGITNMDGVIYKVTAVVDANTIWLIPYDPTTNIPVGTYTGAGVLSLVSKIDIKTKEYNFYQEAQQIAIHKVDLDVDKTVNGEIKIGFYTSTAEEDIANTAATSGIALGDNVITTQAYTLYPLEDQQSRVVRPVYIQAEGDCIQLQFYMDDEQMHDADIQLSDFQLNSMTFYATPTASRY